MKLKFVATFALLPAILAALLVDTQVSTLITTVETTTTPYDQAMWTIIHYTLDVCIAGIVWLSILLKYEPTTTDAQRGEK